jgi:hypothetical protein
VVNPLQHSGTFSVARAVSFLATPPTTTTALCGKEKRFSVRDEERGILLTSPTSVLEALCEPSESPDGNHNIRVEVASSVEIEGIDDSLTT